MDENINETTTTPSTNKFIFADAFYNSLGETDPANNSNEPVQNNIVPNDGELNNIPENNTFQQVEKEETKDEFTQLVDTIAENTNPVEQPKESTKDNIEINLDSNSNMDFLLSGENVNLVESNEENTPEEETKIENPVLEPNTEISQDTNLENNDSVDNKFDDFFETDNESEKDPFEDNLAQLEDNNEQENEKNKFTQFLLGKDAAIPTINQTTMVEVPKKEEVEVYNGPVDESLNVQTGIDKNLENFLFSRRTVAETEQNDEFAPYRKDLEQEEIPVYRASRRKRENSINQSLMANEKTFPTPVYESDNNDQTENTDTTIDIPVNFDVNNDYIDRLSESSSNEDDKWEPIDQPQPIVITEEINYNEPEKYDDDEVVISTLLDELKEKSKETGKISILAKYGDDFCSHNYVTNPAIGREREIKELGLILLTPEKSAILVGKPGIGKTSIVEGLAYRIQRNRVPDALKGYRIVSVKTTSLLGTLPSGETRLQTLIDEIKDLDKIILFVDEVHMLMGATNESSLDFANMFKESLGRGTIKMIGATTSDEYERYVLRDKAFVRRFQRVDVAEPTKDQTVEILMGTLPKIEKNTGAKLKYTHYLQVELMTFIVDITSEYKRVYGIGSRYPDICITLVSQAFSEAVFDNRTEVNVLDIRNAIEHSKNIYPDVISKELINFDEKFRELIKEEKGE